MQFAESGRVPTVRVRVESESACLESESESRCEGLESESESSKIGTRVRLESESKDSSPHLWKIVERLVCQQLVSYLEVNQLLPKHQSAYRKFHSTETAVLKLVSDILLAADGAEVTLLGLLDLSAAFDTVDHDILLNPLQKSFGLGGGVLSWITSFIREKTQTCGFRWRTISYISGIIRRSARECVGSSAVPTVHSRRPPDHST